MRALRDAKTLMSFVMSPSEVLADKTFLRAMVGETADQGLRRVDGVGAVGEGPVMNYLATAAMALRLDTTPRPRSGKVGKF